MCGTASIDADGVDQRRRGTYSDLEEVLAQRVQIWIERGRSLAAIGLAMRNVAGGLDHMSHVEGAPH